MLIIATAANPPRTQLENRRRAQRCRLGFLFDCVDTATSLSMCVVRAGTKSLFRFLHLDGDIFETKLLILQHNHLLLQPSVAGLGEIGSTVNPARLRAA
jgi:hypothetical protein